MAGQQRNGVDAAIALLLALTARGGVAANADLARALDIPRASFHRIATVLAAAGLIVCARGTVRVGPKGEALLRACHDARTAPHRASAVRARVMAPMEPADLPIALTPPHGGSGRGPFRIGFSNASLQNSWRYALVHNVEHAAAAFEDDIRRLTIRHAGESAAQQVADIMGFVADGVDGLIVSALSCESVDGAIAAAMAAGIAVVTVDRDCAQGVPRTSTVTADNDAIGGITALWLAETMGERGTVLMLPGRSDAGPTMRRLDAAQAVLARYPGLRVLPPAWTDWDRAKARTIVGQALAPGEPTIDGVWCDSGLQAAGSIQAFVDANHRRGAVPPHTGGDLNLAYKLAVRHKVRLAALDYPPAMGTRALGTLIASLRGAWVPTFVDVGSDIIITRGDATRSVQPHRHVEDHVRWDLPDELILGSDIGAAYNPRAFRVRYPGNSYNRSAAWLRDEPVAS